MHTVDINLGERSYSVFIGTGILGHPHASLSIKPGSVALIVSNETVAPLYLDALKQSLANVNTHSLILPDGEPFKTQQSWAQIIDKLIDIGATRDATVVTLGGGVIGDMGGFAAACYMRGINFIQIPTSLLSQVDASVGGKTGYNHPNGKNLIGAFHQPVAVVIDIDTLSTLPEREFSAGLAEVVKIAAVRDADFLQWLERNTEAIMQRDPAVISYLIKTSVANKATVVADDEREAGARALLNFGHTFAHALETLTHYQQYLHGEAVAIGMMTAARLSEQRGLCAGGISNRLGALLQAFGLPLAIPDNIGSNDMLALMKLDKKVIAGALRLILLAGAGAGVIDSRSSHLEIAAAIDASRSAK